MENKTLKEFLKKHKACEDGYLFAKDLTLKEFLNTCERGDWILWLFATMNPKSIKELTLAKGHCANTVRHLMIDRRNLKAVDTAIAFGEGRATKQELEESAADAWAAYDNTVAYDTANTDKAYANITYAVACTTNYAIPRDAAVKKNQKQTADICRKYLPLEIWDQSKI